MGILWGGGLFTFLLTLQKILISVRGLEFLEAENSLGVLFFVFRERSEDRC